MKHQNTNERAALITGTSYFDINHNQFLNPLSKYELEVEYNDDKVLDATRNNWSWLLMFQKMHIKTSEK